MKSVRILVMMLGLGLALLPAVVLRSGAALADHEINERANFCVEQVEKFAEVAYALKGNGAKQADVEKLLTKPKDDKDGIEWYELSMQVVAAAFADDLEKVKALDDKAFEACMRFNGTRAHQPPKVKA